MIVNKNEFKEYNTENMSLYMACKNECPTSKHDLWTPEETAKYLRLELSTLAKWRCHQSHPDLPWVKIGSRCFYKRTSIQSFVSKNTFGSDVHIPSFAD